MKDNKQYIVLENQTQRFIDTIVELFGYTSLLFINHLYLSGNGWIDVIFIFMIMGLILTIQSQKTKRFANKEELKKWLESKSL